MTNPRPSTALQDVIVAPIQYNRRSLVTPGGNKLNLQLPVPPQRGRQPCGPLLGLWPSRGPPLSSSSGGGRVLAAGRPLCRAAELPLGRAHQISRRFDLVKGKAMRSGLESSLRVARDKAFGRRTVGARRL